MTRAKASSLKLEGKLQLSRRGRNYLGADRIDLLEAIDRHGSISQAARHLHVSYKAAWDAIDAMNETWPKSRCCCARPGASTAAAAS